MKKFISLIICVCLSFVLIPSANAEQELIVDNFSVHSNYHEFTSDELKGTKFEGMHVEFFDGVAYIDDLNSSEPKRANKPGTGLHIKEKLVGYLIEGIVIYIAGYDGPHFTAAAIASLVDAAKNLNDSIADAFYQSYMAKVNRVVTRSGRDCVAASGGLWRCTMAYFGDDGDE